MYTPKQLNWDYALTTGDAMLDNQHKYLIETLNKLGNAITNGHGKDNIAKILGKLKFYADWHFGKEEKCMETFHCLAIEKNKKAHAVFIEKIDKFQKEYIESSGSDELAQKVHESISDWIINHILIIDGELYPCIHRRQKPKPNK